MTNEDLVKAIQAGSAPDALEQLYLNNEGYIKKLAKRYSGYAETEDLMQEGFFGLYEAAKRYEGDKEVAFMTYAGYWIKQTLKRYVINCCSAVRLPEALAVKLQEYQRFISQYHQYYGQEPPKAVIQSFLGIDDKTFDRIENAANLGTLQSLDEPLGTEEGLFFGDTVSSGEDIEEDITDEVISRELKAVLWLLVSSLGTEQEEVIRRKYRENESLKDICINMGLAAEHVRQLEVRAMRALRKPKYTCRLRPYLTDQETAAAYHGNGVRRFQTTWTSSTERVALRRAEG